MAIAQNRVFRARKMIGGKHSVAELFVSAFGTRWVSVSLGFGVGHMWASERRRKGKDPLPLIRWVITFETRFFFLFFRGAKCNTWLNPKSYLGPMGTHLISLCLFIRLLMWWSIFKPFCQSLIVKAISRLLSPRVIPLKLHLKIQRCHWLPPMSMSFVVKSSGARHKAFLI